MNSAAQAWHIYIILIQKCQKTVKVKLKKCDKGKKSLSFIMPSKRNHTKVRISDYCAHVNLS